MFYATAARPLAAALAGVAPLVALSGLNKRQHCQRHRGVLAICEEPPCNFVDARMAGFHNKGFVNVGDWHCLALCPPITARQAWDTARYYWNIIRPHATVRVRDAREKEDREGLSKRDFFWKFGFALIPHETSMDAADWNASAPNPLGISNLTGYGMPSKDTPLSRKYTKEVEQIIRELLPDAKEIELDPLVVRRGPGTKNPLYNFAPHQDYGFTNDDFPAASCNFKERFVRDDVHGFMVINFWRPVRPMKGPVKKTPLAVCDPSTVKMEDIVPLNVRRDQLGFSKMMDLAYDEDQHWYYYPDMTVDEVLVFKTFQYFKDQAGGELNTCFHTAFEHPTPPPGAEERQSCEYRARIWF